MNALIFILIFIVWYTLSMIIAEKLGKKSRLGEEWTFFVCFVFSPLVGFIVAKTMQPSQNPSAS